MLADLRHHLVQERVVEVDPVARRRPAREAVDERRGALVAGVVLGHDAQRARVLEVPRHAEERDPLVAAAARQRRAREAPVAGRHEVAHGARAHAVDDDARAALHHVVLARDERERGRREADRQPQLLHHRGRRASARWTRARPRRAASPRPRRDRRSAVWPTSARISSCRRRRRPRPPGGRGMVLAACSTTCTRPFCSISRRSPASPRPPAFARTRTGVVGPIALASVTISTVGGGPVRSVTTARAARTSAARSSARSFNHCLKIVILRRTDGAGPERSTPGPSHLQKAASGLKLAWP